MDYLIYLGVPILMLLHYWLFGKLFIKNPKNLPPGPLQIPIIGNLHNLGKRPHQSLAELAKIHGPLMTLKLGSVTTIVASSAFAAQQVLQKHDLAFSNRWVPDALFGANHNDFAISFLPNNATWRNLRKMCNLQLFSNKSLDGNQHLRQKKIEELIIYIHRYSKAGTSVNISQAVFSSNLNFISNTFFSLDLEDPDSAFCTDFKKTVEQIVTLAGQPNLGDYFPIFKPLDLQRIRRRVEEGYIKIIHFIQRLIDQRLANGIDKTTECGDILNAMLKINQANEKELGMPYLIHTIVDLFIGATETTAGTVEWAMAELLSNKSELKKVRAELEAVIGRENRVTEDDITRLPYLQAVIKETLRLHPSVPFLLPRIASSDVNVCGFHIPKDSSVLVNAWAIGRDQSVWERPLCFEPTRFLGSDIDFKGQHFELIPFGGGRRICPGVSLANRNLYLILGSIINCFDWRLEDGAQIHMDEKFGMVVQKATPLLAIPIA